MMRYTIGMLISRHDYVVCARRDIARAPEHIHYWVAHAVGQHRMEDMPREVALFPSIREADEVAELLELDTRGLQWRITTQHI